MGWQDRRGAAEEGGEVVYEGGHVGVGEAGADVGEVALGLRVGGLAVGEADVEGGLGVVGGAAYLVAEVGDEDAPVGFFGGPAVGEGGESGGGDAYVVGEDGTE